MDNMSSSEDATNTQLEAEEEGPAPEQPHPLLPVLRSADVSVTVAAAILNGEEAEQGQQQQQQQQLQPQADVASVTTTTTTTTTSQPVFVFSVNGSSETTQRQSNDTDSPAATGTPASPFVFTLTRDADADSQQQQHRQQRPSPPNNNTINNDNDSAVQQQQQQQQQQLHVPATSSSSGAAASSSSSPFLWTVPAPPSTSTATTPTVTSGTTGQGGIPIPTFAPFSTFSSGDEQARRTLRVRRMGPYRRSSGGSGVVGGADADAGAAGAGGPAAGIRFNIGSGGATQNHPDTGDTGGPTQIRFSLGGNSGGRGRVTGGQQAGPPTGVTNNNNNNNNGGRGGGGTGTGAQQRVVTFAPGVGADGGRGRGGGVGGGVDGGGRQMSLQFRVPPGARVRLHRSGGGLPSMMNNHNSMGMGMGTTTTSMGMGEVRVPPLQPLVMMDSLQNIRSSNTTDNNENGSSSSSDNNINQQHLERFKCTLCCEFMRVAHSCGADQCDSRFCSDCVAKLTAAALNNNIHNNKLCPTCRNVVQGDFVPDESLSADDNMPPIPCRFQGCQERLKLAYVAAHEAICPMVRMCCKYKSFGCSWTGPRGELSQHEQHDCPLAKIPVLVEQHRVLQAMQQHHFGHLNVRTQMAMQLADSHNQRIVQLERSTQQQAAAATAATTTMAMAGNDNNNNRGVSTSNPMDVLSFVCAILITLPNFYKIEFQWRYFLTVEGRAAVYNMTMMLSPTIVFGKLLLEFYTRVLQILGGATDEHQTSCPKTDDCGLYSGAMSLVSCILIASIFLQDNTSSRTWKFRHLTELSQFALSGMHLVATGFGLKFFGLFRGLVLLWWTLVSAVLFPALLAGISIKKHAEHARMGSERPEETVRYISNLCDTGRAFDPLIFGFRTALPCVMFGQSAAVTALLLVEAIQPLFSHVPIGFAMKPHFPGSSINRILEYILLFLVGSALIDLPRESMATDDDALRLVREEFLNNIMGETGRSLFAFLTVIATNLFIWSLSRLGMRLANKLIEWNPVPPPSTSPANKDSSVGGSVIVATWVVVLVFIAAT